MLTWIEINTEAIRANLDSFRRLLPGRAGLMSVVKADAYGHGLELSVQAMADRTDWFEVNSLEEALRTVEVSPQKPVLIMGHSEHSAAGILVHRNIRQVLYRLDLAEALSQEAVSRGSKARVHLKVETGTNRQGVQLKELPQFLRHLRQLPGVELEGLYTHFANIEDTLDPSYANLQRKRLARARTLCVQAGMRPQILHAAASAGAILYPETVFDLLRLGIGAYGIWPSRETQIAARERGLQLELTPALTWKTRIVQLKTIAKGEYVGYGLSFQATRRMKLAVLPTGYFDGYDRKLSNTGTALVRGKAVPVVGRVMMNMTLLDVTHTEAMLDDEVVLIGRQGGTEIRVERLAEKIGSIPYEILSRINPRIPRVIAKRTA